MRDDPVLIIGGPRSGTSLIASVFQACGLWLGECGSSGGPDNPPGFFENHSMRSLDRQILTAGGYDQFGVKPLPPQDWTHQPETVEKLRADVNHILLAQGCPPDQRWGFKDPKLALTWRAWVAAFPKARVIGVLRSPLPMSQSCARARIFARHRDIDWHAWSVDMIARVKAIVYAVPDSGFVWPDDIPRNLASIRHAVKSCGFEWNPEAPALFQSQLWSGG